MKSTLSPGAGHFDRASADYAAVARQRPEFSERFELFRTFIDTALAALPAEHARPRAIDLGCGAGDLTWYLASKGFETYAVDGSESMLKSTQSRLEQEGQQAAALLPSELPFDPAPPASLPAPVDLVVMSSVIEYLDDDALMFQQCRSLLRTGGTLAISFPNARSVYWRLRVATRGVPLVRGSGDWLYQRHRYTVARVRELAGEAGFEIKDIKLYALPYQRHLPSRWTARRPGVAMMFAVRMVAV